MSATGARYHTSARHIHLYAYAWLGYFLLLALLPVQYGRLEAFPALAGLLLWVLISLVVAYAAHRYWSARRPLDSGELLSAGRPLNVELLHRLIWLSLGLSFLGLFSLIYDRVVLQGVDFSQGIAVARHLWRKSQEGREGVSSIFSVVGYLFGFTFFVATSLGHLHWEFLRRRTRWGIIGFACFLVAINSLLTGGRSIVLVQLAMVVAVCGIRSIIGLKMMPGRGARIWLGATVGLVLAVGYSLYVFSARAEVNNVRPEKYVVGMLWYLGATPTDSFYDLNVLPESVAATTQFATVAGAYLTHSYGSFESVLEMQDTPGTVSFGFVRLLFARLGFGENSDTEWSLSGRFLSMPGSLWYDFGWIGFFAGALVTGALVGLAPRILHMRQGGGWAVIAVLMIFMIGLLSPLLLAIDILSVPFMILGFAQVDIAARLIGGSVNWLHVSRTVRRAALIDRENEGLPGSLA
jgi:hypothetical protein